MLVDNGYDVKLVLYFNFVDIFYLEVKGSWLLVMLLLSGLI